MHSPAWQLQRYFARLQSGPLNASLDLTRPADGIYGIRLDDHPLPVVRLLAVAVPALSVGDAGSLADCHVRNGDLIAAYAASEDYPVRVDVLWRARHPLPNEEFLAAVELVLSVRTLLLAAPAELTVHSELEATETLRLLDASSARYEPADVPANASLAMQPAAGLGCLLFRQPGLPLSYAEMIHPADFRNDDLAKGPGPTAMCLSHRLFPGRLEKGVILRARLRAVVVSRTEDTRIAAACYAAFAAGEPPLAS